MAIKLTWLQNAGPHPDIFRVSNDATWIMSFRPGEDSFVSRADWDHIHSWIMRTLELCFGGYLTWDSGENICFIVLPEVLRSITVCMLRIIYDLYVYYTYIYI